MDSQPIETKSQDLLEGSSADKNNAASRKPRKKFIGRRAAAKQREEGTPNGDPSKAIEDSSAIQGRYSYSNSTYNSPSVILLN